MKKFDGTSYFKFALAVAMSCLEDLKCSRGDGVAAYIQKVLELALENTGLTIEVLTLPYHECSKTPIRILVNGEETGLLWYYPDMNDTQLIADLSDLMESAVLSVTRVSA